MICASPSVNNRSWRSVLECSYLCLLPVTQLQKEVSCFRVRLSKSHCVPITQVRLIVNYWRWLSILWYVCLCLLQRFVWQSNSGGIYYYFLFFYQSTSRDVAFIILSELIFFFEGVYFQNRCLGKQRGAAFNSGHCNQLSGGFSDHLVCQVFCPLNARVAEVLFAPCLPVSFRSTCRVHNILLPVILITL